MIDRAYPVVQTGTDTFRPRAHHLVDFYAGDVRGASKPPLVNALDWITDVFFIADLALNFRPGYVRRETGVVDLDPAMEFLSQPFCRGRKLARGQRCRDSTAFFANTITLRAFSVLRHPFVGWRS